MQELAFFYLGSDRRADERREAGATHGARPAAAHDASPCRARACTTSRTSRWRSRATASIVVTGLSGSGKSSLAFDTIYAEGQRRYMESLSSFAKRFVAQVAKPDVDFVFGLSPVISIEQKTIASNPRSTVGTMTDIASYLNLLFATIGEPHCPRTGEPTPSRTSSQILEAILSLPEGTEIELRAPVFKVYGEELDFVFTEVRKKGCRRLIVDGKPVDISDEVELDESTVRAHGRGGRSVRGQPQAREGDQGGDRRARCWSATGCCRSTSSRARARRRRSGSTAALCSATHHFVYGDIGPEYFVFNNPESACRTCGGLGRAQAHAPGAAGPRPEAQHPRRLLRARGVQVQPRHLGRADDVQPGAGAAGSRSTRRGRSCPRRCAHAILYGIEPQKIVLPSPPEAKVKRDDWEGKEVGFGGIARRIERHYRRYRQRGEASSGMEAWLDKVMVEHTCPDCNGARVRATRLLFTVAGKTIHDVGQLNFDELHAFLGTVKPAGRGADAGRQVLKEIRGRLELLLGHRAGLPELQPPLGHALGRRVAAHPAVDADRLGADGDALRARRAEHRPAPEGQRQDDRDAGAACATSATR